MINICINWDSMLDVLVFHGDKAVDSAFDTIKEEFYEEVNRLKASGKYEEYSKSLYQALEEKAAREVVVDAATALGSGEKAM